MQELSPGSTLSHYRIVSKIGEGGMGEVYLAQDTKLDRKVALKILPAEVALNHDRMERFVREAKSAAALHHPNIAQIFEIGEYDGAHYIAMEYVEGETLRQLLARPTLEIKRAVEFAAQVAAGLAAAHKAGVIHRDIKPENLAVTSSRQIKILDFGLAKLVGKEQGSTPLGELTTAQMPSDETTPGSILGTVAYMSPEQARAEKLDQRTDIFSLGVVLYETLTGERPFRGKSAIDTLHAIINHEPPSITQLNSHLPPELADILSKALAKETSERYQHAGDFELDLRRFKRALESNSLISTQVQRPAITERATRSKLSLPVLIFGALIVLGIAVAAWLLGHSSVPPRHSTLALENVTLTPLTTEPGYEGEPTFSPDGETIAYVSDRTGNFEIFLKQVTGGPDIQLTTSSADDVQPAFSPDGKQIAFVSTRSSQTALFYPVTDSPMIGGDVWVMSALGDKGGNARRIAEHGNFPSWSPDGKEILYMSEARGQRMKISRVPAAGGEAREVPLKFGADQNQGTYAFYPRFSSDGHWITFQKNDDTIYVVSAEGGEVQLIARGKAPAWSADSSAIIYSNREPGKNLALWQIPFSLAEGKPVGRAEPLTVSRGWDLHAAVSRNGKTIAFTAEEDSFNVETVPFDAETGRVSGEPNPLTTGQNINFFVNLAPDARSVVFQSARGSSTHIWRTNPDSPPVQLTSDPEFNDTYPRWSPDGHSISFIRTPVGGPSSAQSQWLMTADGANPQKLGDGWFGYAWMPDGHAIVGWSRATRQLGLFDVSTKQQRAITNEEGVGQVVAISSDGKWIAYHSTVSGNVDVRIVPIEGGESRVAVDTPRYDVHPFFSPSGKWLYFQPDHKNIYRVPGPAQDWRKAEPEKVTNFPESGLFLEDPQISRDGRWLLYSRGRITGDIWIMNLGK